MNEKMRLVAMLTVFTALVLAPSVQAEDGWKFGIGTGLFGLNIDGDVGLNAGGLGPVTLPAELDGSEIRDVAESAFGFGGFAAKGKWHIVFAAGHLVLEDSAKGTTQVGMMPASAAVEFEANSVEIVGAREFARSESNVWSVLFGTRHTEHKIDFGLDIGGAMSKVKIDESWTDALVGVTHSYVIGPKMAWSSRVDAGFGGSEGTVSAQTGLDWHVAKAWSMSFFGKFTAVDFENASAGAADWYLYDVDEFGLGASFVYMF